MKTVYNLKMAALPVAIRWKTTVGLDPTRTRDGQTPCLYSCHELLPQVCIYKQVLSTIPFQESPYYSNQSDLPIRKLSTISSVYSRPVTINPLENTNRENSGNSPGKMSPKNNHDPSSSGDSGNTNVQEAYKRF